MGNEMRKSGVLLAVSSLPGEYGIGSFGQEAYDFVDFLVSAGQHYWQILPLGPTGYGDSPYQSFSTFAGNPYYIDLEKLIQLGLLTKSECDSADLCDYTVAADSKKKERLTGHVNYGKIYIEKMGLLRKAFSRFDREDRDYCRFIREEKDWLYDYALFMAFKAEEDGASFIGWDKPSRNHTKKALKAGETRLKDEVEFTYFCQYFFFLQWEKLKKYANGKGIKIIGDIPIYVAADSADAWANPELFELDDDRIPIKVAGCPPDYFAKTGQLWGNPLYDWEYHKKTGYAWWIKRMKHCYRLYDVVRIDHFRGFESYYTIPYGNETAEIGEWVKGPGVELFRAIEDAIGEQPVIAEDLGFLTDSVRRMIDRTGYPGMKILEFAFDGETDNEHLPYNLKSNCVIYTGTHDNETIVGWYKDLPAKYKKSVNAYLNIRSGKNIHWDMIRLAFSSVADTVVIPMQDFLGLDNSARMNIPSTLGGNWIWRMQEEDLSPVLSGKLYEMTKTYGRL